MKICKTCKHWEANSRLERFDGETGDSFCGEHRLCNCAKIVDISGMGFDQTSSLEHDTGAVDDSDSFRAYFYTGPDFGCIHHEPNE